MTLLKASATCDGKLKLKAPPSLLGRRSSSLMQIEEPVLNELKLPNSCSLYSMNLS
jgi:hypothetical protein